MMKVQPASTKRVYAFRKRMAEDGALRFEVTLSAETLAAIKDIARIMKRPAWRVVDEAVALLREQTRYR